MVFPNRNQFINLYVMYLFLSRGKKLFLLLRVPPALRFQVESEPVDWVLLIPLFHLLHWPVGTTVIWCAVVTYPRQNNTITVQLPQNNPGLFHLATLFGICQYIRYAALLKRSKQAHQASQFRGDATCDKLLEYIPQRKRPLKSLLKLILSPCFEI